MKDSYFILKFLKNYKKPVIFGASLILISPAFTIMIPIMIKNIIDSDIPSGNIDNLARNFIIILIMFIISKLVSYLQSVVFYKTNCRVVKDVRNELFKKIFSCNIQDTLIYENGDLVTRVEDDIKNLSVLFVNQIASLITSIITLFASVYMMISISKLLSLLSSIMIIGYIIITKVFKQKIEKYSQIYIQCISNCKTELINFINNIDFIKLNRLDDFAVTRYDDETNKKMLANIDLGTSNITGSHLVDFLLGLFPYFTILIGGILVIKGDFTIGSIIAFNTYLRNTISPLESITNFNFNFSKSKVSLKRMNDILNLNEMEIREIETFNGVKLKNVSVNIHGKKILNNISLDIRKGDKIVIVGQSGSGKTTLVNVILGKQEITQGEIDRSTSINKSYAFNGSYLKSESYIYKSGLEENICMGRQVNVADLSNVIDIAEITKQMKYNKNMPSNYSHGEKQKVNLARALYDKHDYLVIDEGLSNIDGKDLDVIVDKLLCDDNLSLLYITHNNRIASKFSKQIHMKNGEISHKSKVNELLLS